jgi:hypothetical protein
MLYRLVRYRPHADSMPAPAVVLQSARDLIRRVATTKIRMDGFPQLRISAHFPVFWAQPLLHGSLLRRGSTIGGLPAISGDLPANHRVVPVESRRHPNTALDDLQPSIGQHLVESCCGLGVPVTDQKSGLAARVFHGDCARAVTPPPVGCAVAPRTPMRRSDVFDD